MSFGSCLAGVHSHVLRTPAAFAYIVDPNVIAVQPQSYVCYFVACTFLTHSDVAILMSPCQKLLTADMSPEYLLYLKTIARSQMYITFLRSISPSSCSMAQKPYINNLDGGHFAGKALFLQGGHLTCFPVLGQPLSVSLLHSIFYRRVSHNIAPFGFFVPRAHNSATQHSCLPGICQFAKGSKNVGRHAKVHSQEP